MPMPNIRSLRLPLLEFGRDGIPWHKNALLPYLSERFQMSEEDLAAKISTGRHVIKVRIDAALVRAKKEGLLQSTARGYYQITNVGRQHLDLAVPNGGVTLPSDQEPEQSPQELLDAASRALDADLATSLLDSIQGCTPEFFERLIVDLMVKMGYGGSREEAGHVIGGSGDEGIDGIINEDPLGLDTIYLQAKRWSNVVGRRDVQQFAGALQGRKARKGVFITTASFTAGAKAFADGLESRIILIDGARLAKLMIEHDIGVTTEHTYEIKRINTDYFQEE